jgi:hypothetical protein
VEHNIKIAADGHVSHCKPGGINIPFPRKSPDMEKISTILDSAHGLLSDPHGPDALSWREVDIDGRKIIVPSFWSDTAARILATKYMRKDGVPMQLERRPN